MALVAYHLVIQHNPTFSSSAQSVVASGPDSADEDSDADPMSALRDICRSLQEGQASSQATSTAASGLHSRLPQLHMQLLQQLGFSSKLVAVAAASERLKLGRPCMCVICGHYAEYVDHMMWQQNQRNKQQGRVQQQSQQQQQHTTQGRQYAAVHACLGSLLLSWAANMPPGDSQYLEDCYHAAVAAAAGLKYWSHLQTCAHSAAAASRTGMADDTTTALEVLRMSPEEQQERMVQQLQRHAKLALLPEALAAELTRGTLPTVLHMLTQLLPQCQAHSCSVTHTCSADTAASSSSSSSSGRCAALPGVTEEQTKGSTPGVLSPSLDTDHAVLASDSSSNTASDSRVNAAAAVHAVLEFTRQLAAHTSHASQKAPSILTTYVRGPDRKPQIVAWDQHAAKLSLLLERLVRLEAEQPGLLPANGSVTTMWCIGALAMGCFAGSYQVMRQLQDAAAVAAPGGVLQSRYCSLLTSLFKYHSKQAQAAVEPQYSWEQVADGALSLLHVVGSTREGFVPRFYASAPQRHQADASPAGGPGSDLGLPGGSKRLSNMVPALNLLGRCLMMQGARLQAIEAEAAGQAAQPQAAVNAVPSSTTTSSSAAASSSHSLQGHQPAEAAAGAGAAASSACCSGTTITPSAAGSGAVTAPTAQQATLASDASRTYLKAFGSQTLLTLSATSAWLPRRGGSLPSTQLQDQEVTSHVRALGGNPKLLVQQREATVAAWHAVNQVEAATHSAVMTLAQQLSTFGRALCSLPFPQACNNPSCTNTEGLTESDLIKGSSKTCAGCHKARYCSKACQQQAWKLHKPVCWALAAATAQRALKAAGKASGATGVDG